MGIMGDLISRQAAIDALCALYEYQRSIDPTERADLVRQGVFLAEQIIEKLPSAQSEQSSEIQDIINYMDTVLHPIVSPDHWDVYSNLYDMVLELCHKMPDSWGDGRHDEIS